MDDKVVPIPSEGGDAMRPIADKSAPTDSVSP